jgi:hypothetical protein
MMVKDKRIESKNPGGGLKKRQQIEKAARSMFIWVAVASIAVSVCVVTAQFLFQKWAYNNRVLDTKSRAAETLKSNISNAKQLRDSVGALVSNSALASVKTSADDPNTKSILDALPSRFDATAWATSLQQTVLSRSGVTVESIHVPGDQDDPSGDVKASASATTPQEMKFDIAVSGSYDKIRNMLLDLERTIRPVKVTSVTLRGDDAAMSATVSGITYYQSSKSATIKQEVVK